MRNGKRGLSPVIASVLMILLVIVLATIVFSWARGFVEANSENPELSSEKLCRSVDFNIVVVDRSGEDYDFEVVNRGDINVSAFKFRIFPGGDSNIVHSPVILLAGESASGTVTLPEPIDRVEVLAVLDGALLGQTLDAACFKDPVNLDGFYKFHPSA